jgi:hypothetical protein
MKAAPVDLIERLRHAGDHASAESVTEIARCLAMMKRYFEEYTGAQVDEARVTPEAKCLAAVNEALERVRHPY